MRMTLTIIDRNPVHVYLTLHINGACAGGLTMRVDEFKHFLARVKPEKLIDNTIEKCQTCGGTGEVDTMEQVYPGEPHMAPIGTGKCPDCDGTGIK